MLCGLCRFMFSGAGLNRLACHRGNQIVQVTIGSKDRGVALREYLVSMFTDCPVGAFWQCGLFRPMVQIHAAVPWGAGLLSFFAPMHRASLKTPCTSWLTTMLPCTNLTRLHMRNTCEKRRIRPGRGHKLQKRYWNQLLFVHSIKNANAAGTKRGRIANRPRVPFCSSNI